MKRGIDVEHATRREILRKQMELLAEDSLNPNCLVENSRELVRINQELSKPFRIAFLVAVLTNSLISVSVFIKKFFWC